MRAFNRPASVQDSSSLLCFRSFQDVFLSAPQCCFYPWRLARLIQMLKVTLCVSVRCWEMWQYLWRWRCERESCLYSYISSCWSLFLGPYTNSKQTGWYLADSSVLVLRSIHKHSQSLKKNPCLVQLETLIPVHLSVRASVCTCALWWTGDLSRVYSLLVSYVLWERVRKTPKTLFRYNVYNIWIDLPMHTHLYNGNNAQMPTYIHLVWGSLLYLTHEYFNM